MTVQEAITQADELKPNQYDDSHKLQWLTYVEGIIVDEIINTHEGEKVDFTEYDKESYSDDLIVPEPYSNLYVQYILSQIDYYNGEFNRYNNTSAMFNATYINFTNYWNRLHQSNAENAVRY